VRSSPNHCPADLNNLPPPSPFHPTYLSSESQPTNLSYGAVKRLKIASKAIYTSSLHCFYILVERLRAHGSDRQHPLYQRFSHKQHKKRFDHFNSHEENVCLCHYCDKHNAHLNGKNSDCCPKYVDTSLALEIYAPENEEVIENPSNGSPPKHRQIDPLYFPRTISEADKQKFLQNDTRNDTDVYQDHAHIEQFSENQQPRPVSNEGYFRPIRSANPIRSK